MSILTVHNNKPMAIFNEKQEKLNKAKNKEEKHFGKLYFSLSDKNNL